MVKIKRDGNGGYAINVQKDILRRWGPAGLIIFLLITGQGTSVGSEIWNLMLGRQAIEQQVEHNTAEISLLHVQSAAQFSELRQGQARLTEILLNDRASVPTTEEDQ